MSADAVKAQRWVITGGTGFFGVHLAQRLVSEGVRPVLLDPAPLDESGLAGHVDWRPVDVRDAAGLNEAFAGADVVVHAGAALPLARPEVIYEVNVVGTRNACDAAHRQRVSRFVYLSSASIYGISPACPIRESDAPAPLGPYGESKLAAERICREHRARGLDVTILRPVTFIGIGRLGVFQILFDWVHAGKRIPILGDGRNRFQLLDVADLVEAVCLAARAAITGDDYNLGADRFGSTFDDLGALCRHAETGARVVTIPSLPAKSALRLLDSLHLSPLYRWIYEACDQDYFVDNARIADRLGFSPRSSNAEMLCRTYDWYLAEGIDRSHREGTGHRTAWKQGILRIVRALS